MDLPKTFDEFVDARNRIIRAKEFKTMGENWLAAFVPIHHRNC